MGKLLKLYAFACVNGIHERFTQLFQRFVYLFGVIQRCHTRSSFHRFTRVHVDGLFQLGFRLNYWVDNPG